MPFQSRSRFHLKYLHPLRGLVRRRRQILAGAAVFALFSWGAGADAQAVQDLRSAESLNIKKVELRQVELQTPERLGFGEEARYFDRAVEIRVEVDPFPEGNIEPVLWVGEQELRGHRIVRNPGSYVLAFDAYEPEKLAAGACIHVGTTKPQEKSCTATYEPSAITAGERLVEERIVSLGRPPVQSWGQDATSNQCSSGILPPIGPKDYYGYEIAFFDPQDRRVEELQPGDTLGVEISNIPPLRQVQLRIVDDFGQEWAYARLSSDREGHVDRTLLWFNTGVIGTTSRKLDYRPEPAFVNFEESFQYWNRYDAHVEILDDRDRVIDRRPLPIAATRTEPLVYPSNSQGTLMNAMQVGEDPFYVTGTHFPEGSTVLVFVVPNRYGWQLEDPFQDITGEGLGSDVTVVQLARGQTSFTVQPWPTQLQRSGRFDIITRVVPSPPSPDQLNTQVQAFSSTDRVSFGADTAVNLFDIINGHIVMEIAGRRLDALPWYDSSWFEFADVFESGETVYGAVDPTDFPPSHTGGEYAAYFVVEAQPDTYWDAPNPALVDISGPGMTSQPEIAQVKYGCINVTRTGIWPNANPPGCSSDYQVIVDFGAVPATSSGAYVFDNEYDKGTDFIDRYPEPGFTVIDPPADCCLHSVGQQDHYDDVTTGTDPNRAFDLTSLGFPLVRNWFTIRYPAQAPGGVGAALPAGTDRYPVVLFLHGRHPTCASGGAFNPSCRRRRTASPATGAMTTSWTPWQSRDISRFPSMPTTSSRPTRAPITKPEAS